MSMILVVLLCTLTFEEERTMPKAQGSHDDGFRRNGGGGNRGWGGKVNRNDLTREVAPVSPKPKIEAVEPPDEHDLHERLRSLHHFYFKSGKPIVVTYQSIGMTSLQELSEKFAEYDAVRSKSRKNRDSKRLAAIVATLLGLKKSSA